MRYAVVLFLLSSLAIAKNESYSIADEVKNATDGVAALRAVMREPESLVVEHIYAKMEHKVDRPVICISYRAKNGFGGFSAEIAEYKGGRSINPNMGRGFGWCSGIERNLDRAMAKGWSDITPDYQKSLSSSGSHE